MKRSSIAVPMLVMCAVLFARCDGNPTDADFTPPSDDLGVVAIAPDQPIHIAFWGVLSGADATLGLDAKRGVEIAIDDRGATLLDRPIQLTSEDALCTPEGGIAAATKIASDASVVALIGSACSSEAAAGVPILNAAGMTTISPVNTNPSFTDPDFRGPGGALESNFAGYLRTAHSDAVQGTVAAQFAYQELGLRSAVTIHDGTPYPDGLQQVFAEEFNRLGGTIVSQNLIGANDTDMGPVLAKIGAEQPDFIYMPVYIAAGSRLTAQARQMSALDGVVLMGADALYSPEYAEGAGAAAQGVFLSAPDITTFTSGYAAFLQKYKSRYGDPVSIFHAHAYDAANILFEAIERAAVEGPDGTLYIGRQRLRDEMYATRNYNGLIGTLTCNAYGDCSAANIAVYEITARETGGAWPPVSARWQP